LIDALRPSCRILLDTREHESIQSFRYRLFRSARRGLRCRLHVGDFLAVGLDGAIVGRPPIIRDEIGRNGQVDLGNASLEETQDLALALRAGALPVPLSVVRATWVGE
jgi:preprotein translocase subunit SecD